MTNNKPKFEPTKDDLATFREVEAHLQDAMRLLAPLRSQFMGSWQNEVRRLDLQIMAILSQDHDEAGLSPLIRILEKKLGAE